MSRHHRLPGASYRRHSFRPPAWGALRVVHNYPPRLDQVLGRAGRGRSNSARKVYGDNAGWSIYALVSSASHASSDRQDNRSASMVSTKDARRLYPALPANSHRPMRCCTATTALSSSSRHSSAVSVRPSTWYRTRRPASGICPASGGNSGTVATTTDTRLTKRSSMNAGFAAVTHSLPIEDSTSIKNQSVFRNFDQASHSSLTDVLGPFTYSRVHRSASSITTLLAGPGTPPCGAEFHCVPNCVPNLALHAVRSIGMD